MLAMSHAATKLFQCGWAGQLSPAGKRLRHITDGGGSARAHCLRRAEGLSGCPGLGDLATTPVFGHLIARQLSRMLFTSVSNPWTGARARHNQVE